MEAALGRYEGTLSQSRVTYEGAGADLLAENDEPPARPDERAARASSGAKAPAIIAAATMEARGRAIAVRICSSFCAWQVIRATDGLDMGRTCLVVSSGLCDR